MPVRRSHPGRGKPIEKIGVGDRAYARDLAPGATRLRRVVGLLNKPANRLLGIRVAGTTVSVTPEHPFYVPGRGWVLAGDLRVGTSLLQRDGTVTPIEAIAHREEPTTVYNFVVEGDHNYYVSPAQLLVHNCSLNPGPYVRELPDGRVRTYKKSLRPVSTARWRGLVTFGSTIP